MAAPSYQAYVGLPREVKEQIANEARYRGLTMSAVIEGMVRSVLADGIDVGVPPGLDEILRLLQLEHLEQERECAIAIDAGNSAVASAAKARAAACRHAAKWLRSAYLSPPRDGHRRR